jgi:hypothetical protein
MRDAQPVRDALGIVNILPGAARTLAAYGGTVVVKLESYANNLVTGARHHAGNNGAVNAAGHGNDDFHAALRKQGLWFFLEKKNQRPFAKQTLWQDECQRPP